MSGRTPAGRPCGRKTGESDSAEVAGEVAVVGPIGRLLQTSVAATTMVAVLVAGPAPAGTWSVTHPWSHQLADELYSVSCPSARMCMAAGEAFLAHTATPLV